MSSPRVGMHSALRHLQADLDDLERRDLLRARPSPRDRQSVDRVCFCSNDYLGYASERRLAAHAEAASTSSWTGAGASRLIAGEHAPHRALERSLAEWLRAPETLVFSSGYAANLGVVSALADEGDLIVSDALNHASIIDGCRLSRARTVVVPHLDQVAVRAALSLPARRRWVVTESYFSMDGDSPDFAALRALCDELDAGLIVDEAHALGVFGPEGRGLAAAAGIVPDVLVGTLGKALGAQGAFVAGSEALVSWLWNRARPFVFSTGMSPLLAAVAEAAVTLARSDEAGRARLLASTDRLRAGLRSSGLEALVGSFGPIVPLIVGGCAEAVAASKELAAEGVDVQAIRPPTVAEGTSRLRLALSAAHTEADVDRALAALTRLRFPRGVPVAST